MEEDATAPKKTSPKPAANADPFADDPAPGEAKPAPKTN
jgi:hypothetical protein